MSGLLMAEEKLENIQVFLLRLQEQAETLKDGFSVSYKGEEFDFVADFIDR